VFVRPTPNLGDTRPTEVIRRRLAEKTECLNQIFRGLACLERRRPGLLGQLLPGRVDGNRQMGIAWRGVPEAALQQYLARRRGQQISAAHDLGNALIIVVDRNSQLISETAIRTQQNEVADIAGQSLVSEALQTIGKRNFLIIHPQTPGPCRTALRQAIPAGTGIDQAAIARRMGRQVGNFLA